MKYRIFIDETGDFTMKRNIRRNTDFVGGWVCPEDFTYKITRLLNDKIRPINRDIEKVQGEEFTLKVPGHLHFMALHLPEKRVGKDRHVKVPFSKVRDIVSTIFGAVIDDALFVFRSYGFPRYYVNEQAAYFEILRAAILQVLDEIPFSREDSIRITLGARRVERLMGEYGYANKMEYEKQFRKDLESEISDVFKGREGAGIRIDVEDARNEVELGVADLFCGALRWENFDYLGEYKEKRKIREYNIHNAFIYISNRTAPRIQYIFQNDPVMGLMQGFEHLARNPDNMEINRAVKAMRGKISPSEARSFGNELEIYLHEKLIEDPYRYRNLDSASSFMDEIEKMFTGKRIHGILKKFRIKVLTHKGRTDVDAIRDYLDFLEKHGSEILGSMYRVAQERLETILSIVQPAAFNVFEFEAVEDYLGEEIRNYERLFPTREGVVDETRARLEGTIGQMYAFLSDYPDGDAFFEDALSHLQKDVEYCLKNSYYWTQGMGYLTSLYFKKGDFNNALQSFAAEIGFEKQNMEDIFDLSIHDPGNAEQGDFSLLHRLYICALGLRNQMPVKGEDSLADKLIQSDSRSRYPVFLSVKWLGVIYAMKGRIDHALELFESIDTRQSGNFTIDVIKLPIKALVHMCKKELKKRSKLDLSAELERLENRSPGIKDNLNKLGIEKYMEYDKSWDYYQLSSLMPFYYS